MLSYLVPTGTNRVYELKDNVIKLPSFGEIVFNQEPINVISFEQRVLVVGFGEIIIDCIHTFDSFISLINFAY